MLEGKVVVITGSGQGIGKHAAKTFAQERAKVVIADFSDELAKKTAGEISEVTESMAVHADVRDEASVKKLFEQVVNRFGQIDVLINNAAIVPHFAWNIPRWPLIADMPVDFWDRVIHTNLYGTFFGTKHVIPHMKQRKTGHIINLYGGGGVKPGGAVTYMVTKDGIRTFTRYVAEEVRDDNICVVTFSPRVPIATETAPEEAIKRLPGPEILGQGFVLAAQLPMDQSGKCFAHENGKLVEESAREG
ncbi:MAG TPA: SDR family oxidoreductase [Candidatus Binatia bacterium]|nr:SDR family oxidoreductase [Candidatus Binatia bacterium]